MGLYMVAISEGQIWGSYRKSFTYILNTPKKGKKKKDLEAWGHSFSFLKLPFSPFPTYENFQT